MGTVYRMKGREMWMLKYYDHGKAIYESAKTSDKAEAERLLQQREEDLVIRSGLVKGVHVSPLPETTRQQLVAALAAFRARPTEPGSYYAAQPVNALIDAIEAILERNENKAT